MLCCASLELVGASGHDQTNDQAEEAQNTAEYFDDQDLDEELRISSICYGGIATCDTHCNTAAQIAHAYRQSSPKQHVPSEVVAGSPESIGCTRFEVARDLGREHNRHDNAIDRHHFAEDDPAVNSPSEKKEAKTSMLEPGSKLQSEKQGKQPKTEKKTYETRFFVVMRGALTPAPKMLAPVIKMPQPAPTTERPMHRPMPIIAQA